MISFAAQLRQELSHRNSAYAKAQDLPHVFSYGELPVTVYEPSPDGKRHGNFFDASYCSILKQIEWRKRLEKAHAQAVRSLPRSDRSWKELDSCMSSDALLMNVFCHPRTLKSTGVNSMLGIESTVTPKFGFPARVPLLNGRTDSKASNSMAPGRGRTWDTSFAYASACHLCRFSASLLEIWRPVSRSQAFTSSPPLMPIRR
jgi:hypothetical protein